MITALCGGVGGSKLAAGLYASMPGAGLTVVVNTADDLELWGLHMSPDLDTVTYTLAGMERAGVGWGLEGDTFQALGMMRRYDAPGWFQVGDADLATHVFRTHQLRSGRTLTQSTAEIAARLGVRARILPMTDSPVATQLLSGGAWLDFQEYFVRLHHAVAVEAVRYHGVEMAAPTAETIQALTETDGIVLVNSNPVLSILPILSVPGMRELMTRTDAPRVAVSPMLGQGSVAGPAGALMRLVGQPPTSQGVARLYQGLIDGIVIHCEDQDQAAAIEAMGIRVLCADTLMRNRDDRMRVARRTMEFMEHLA